MNALEQLEEIRKIIKSEELRIRINISTSLADQFHRRRQQLGMTQTFLGTLVGANGPRISLIESGRYEALNLRSLTKMAAALNCNLKIDLIPNDSLNSLTNNLD